MADRLCKDDDDEDYDNNGVEDYDDDNDDDNFFEQAQRRRRQCINCCATYEDDADEVRRLCPRCVTFRHCSGCKRRLPDSCFSTTANDDHAYHRVLSVMFAS